VTSARGRHGPAVAALVLLALAAVLILFALDVRTWQRTVQRDDLRFRESPSTTDLWRPATILPGDPAGLALSTGDTIEWRRALQSFWLAREALAPGPAQKELLRLQTRAERTLQRMMFEGRAAAERSDAANLFGILSLTTATPPAQYFREAIALDPSNGQAKQNLELTLRLKPPRQPPKRKRVRTGTHHAHAPGAEQTGNGY
jgi:hypothetical protein